MCKITENNVYFIIIEAFEEISLEESWVMEEQQTLSRCVVFQPVMACLGYGRY